MPGPPSRTSWHYQESSRQFEGRVALRLQMGVRVQPKGDNWWRNLGAAALKKKEYAASLAI